MRIEPSIVILFGMGVGLGCPAKSEAPPAETPKPAISASAQPTEEDAPFSADPKGFRRAMRRYRADFRACYDAGKQRGLELDGHLRVKFMIAPPPEGGEVAIIQEPRTAAPTPEDEKLSTCVLAVVNKLRFQPPTEPNRVTYPFRFEPKAKAPKAPASAPSTTP